MIIAIQQIDKEVPNIQFKRLYLCFQMNILEMIEDEYIDDFITYDDGIPANINDPFLLSYIYAN
jgi:hypothetical protein